jgi:hypothetical protein
MAPAERAPDFDREWRRRESNPRKVPAGGAFAVDNVSCHAPTETSGRPHEPMPLVQLMRSFSRAGTPTVEAWKRTSHAPGTPL